MWVWRQFKSLYEYFVLYGSLLFFALICLAWSLPAAVLRHLLPKHIAVSLGQYTIMLGFRAYLCVVRASGLVKCDLNALDVLRGETLIITTNHPALIDVVLIGSRLPRMVCVLKATLLDNPMLGGGASMAGYIRNDSIGNLIRSVTAATHEGSQLLIFPEAHAPSRSQSIRSKAALAWSRKKPVYRYRLCSSRPAVRFWARVGRC